MAGLGVASTQILPPISTLPYIKITAAADTRTDALQKFRETYKGEAFTSVAAMCESPNVDAVYIATPNQLHAEHVIVAAERGKHAIVEKPMALMLEDCDKMNAAVARAGIRVVVGHTHSFDPPILRIREIVRSGDWDG
jgi:phthalate 4,5-cis-dihydrodiol dehydrogenase